MAQAESRTSARFVLIDALRGIAALVVLLYHLFHNADMALVEQITKTLPSFGPALIVYGYYGVQIFFVLSGFVIAHSLRKTPLSPKSVGYFILRRQLRLDPPFWTTLFIACGLLALEARIPALQSEGMPTLKAVLLNMVYLHKITGAQDIVTVSWTLCIEVQFYLVFIAVLGLGTLFSPARKARPAAAHIASSTSDEVSGGVPLAALFIVLAMGLYSLLAHWSGSTEGSFTNFWFIVYWCYFAGGVLCYWTIRRGFNIWLFLGYLALLWCYAIIRSDVNVFFGAATLSLLTVAGLKNRLTQWGQSRPVQYLGRISYSLYLVHTLVISYVYRGANKIFGLNPLVGLACIPLTIVLSLAAAHLLHIAVERPSMAFAGRFRFREKIQSEVSGFAAPGGDSNAEKNIVPESA